VCTERLWSIAIAIALHCTPAQRAALHEALSEAVRAAPLTDATVAVLVRSLMSLLGQPMSL
jgi:hypothetical protein